MLNVPEPSDQYVRLYVERKLGAADGTDLQLGDTTQVGGGAGWKGEIRYEEEEDMSGGEWFGLI